MMGAVRAFYKDEARRMVERVNAMTTKTSPVLDALRKEVSRGEFVLKSGRGANWYLDARPVIFGEYGMPAATLMFKRALETFGDFDVVGGPALGGAVLARMADAYGETVAWREAKDHGKPNSIIGNVEGKRLVLLDDVFTTGGTLQRMIRDVVEQGGEIVGIVVLLCRAWVPPEQRMGLDDHRGYCTSERPMVMFERIPFVSLWYPADLDPDLSEG